MKITGLKQELFIKKPDPDINCILLYGPDQGLVRERAQQLIKTTIDTQNDSFCIVEFSNDEIKKRPGLLSDEARAFVLGGGRRVIRLKEFAESNTKIIADFLKIAKTEDALIIIECHELGPRSNLRNLFEKSKNAAAIACYNDNSRSLIKIINGTLKDRGLTPSTDALNYLENNLGNDRSITRNELEKLILYMGGPGPLNLFDVVALIDDNSRLELDDITLATGSGDRFKLDKAYNRAIRNGTHPIQILRATARHFSRLHEALGMIASGENPETAIKKLKPPVMFMHVDIYKLQLHIWKSEQLGIALDLLTKAEIQCKKSAMPIEALCERTLFRIAQTARNRER